MIIMKMTYCHQTKMNEQQITMVNHSNFCISSSVYDLISTCPTQILND